MLVLCVIISACIFARLMALPVNYAALFSAGNQGLNALSIVVVILVASIPIAIEVVSTSTLAVGAHTMASKQVIVARLNAIEELAGMTVLCSDKTGTLTLNQLSLDDTLVRCFPLVAADGGAAAAAALAAAGLAPADGALGCGAVKLLAALASRREGKPDAIDMCIVAALDEPGTDTQKQWKEEYAIPFDPVSKRTIVTVTRDGARVRVCKGAPQKVLDLCANKAAIAEDVTNAVQLLAGRGYRALGVAVCANPAPGVSTVNGPVGDERWLYVGIVPLFDPPRKDTRTTIEAAVANGIEVKMITGDQTAIAKETCRQLGMGANILEAHVLDTTSPEELAAVDAVIMEAHGFAEVLPKHKFQIVERIRKMGHITGMTGDGVNDAPALKRADIGIAVHGATDAAKAAASIVLTEPGLSVIIDAIYESRRIFQRMRSYFIYRITCTIQILAFFFFMIICANLDGSYFYNGVYPSSPPIPPATTPCYDCAHAQTFSLPVLALVFLTIIDDGACIAVSSDTIRASNKPQLWAMWEMWIVSIVMGLLLALSTLLLCVALLHDNALRPGGVMGTLFASNNPNTGQNRGYMLYTEASTVIFLQLAVSNMLTLVAARERGFFFNSVVSMPLGISILVAFIVSTVFSLFWTQMFAGGANATGNGGSNNPNSGMASLSTSNGAIVATFLYCWLWFCVQDTVKVGTYYFIDKYFEPFHKRLILNHAKAHAPAALKEASHPTEGAAEIVQRAKKIGNVGETAQLTVTAQGTVVVHEKPKPAKSTLAGIFNPTDSHADAHQAHAHSAILPNNVDLTSMVLGVQGTLRSTNGKSGAALALSHLNEDTPK